MDTLKNLIPEKFNSDRLWALAGYAAVLMANAYLALGIPEEQLTELLYAVIAFILGKSIRGTTGGSFVQALAPKLIEATARIEPKVDVGAQLPAGAAGAVVDVATDALEREAGQDAPRG